MTLPTSYIYARRVARGDALMHCAQELISEGQGWPACELLLRAIQNHVHTGAYQLLTELIEMIQDGAPLLQVDSVEETLDRGLFFAGLIHLNGWFGMFLDQRRARELFEKAADQQHVFSIFLLATMGYATQSTSAAVEQLVDWDMMRRAETLGCGLASYYLAEKYESQHDYPRASLFYHRGLRRGASRCKIPLHRLLQLKGELCTPLSCWEPCVHLLVPHQVRIAMFSLLLVCSRYNVVSRHLRLLLLSYVCTPSGWIVEETQQQREERERRRQTKRRRCLRRLAQLNSLGYW